MTISGSEYILELIRLCGVETVFGYPGGAILPVYDALPQSGLEAVLVRHEQGAALAAGGYARATNRVGVCISTSGRELPTSLQVWPMPIVILFR